MKKTLSTLALSLFAFAGIAQAADITVENAAGKQVVPQNPQRVIVLGFWGGRYASCIRCAR